MQPTHHSAEHDRTATLTLRGDLVLDDAADLYMQLRKLSEDEGVETVRVDFGEAGRLDTAGAAAVMLGVELFERTDRRCELLRLSEQHRQALALVAQRRRPVEEHGQPIPSLSTVFARLALARTLGRFAEVVVDTVGAGVRCVSGRDRRRIVAVAEQTVVLGVDAWFIVAVLSFLIGVILAFQGAFQLRKFGAAVYMAELVSLGMVREFASIITAIILAGRSGAAMAAELGTMTVHEEVDALKAMGISTTQFLVFPRVAGITLAQPLLTLMSMAVGLGAGLAISGVVGVSPAVAYRRMQGALTMDDFLLGLVKSVLFAWIIGFVGCSMGLSARGGAQSVGRKTTAAVVLSIFLVVVTDSIVTTVWTLTYNANQS